MQQCFLFAPQMALITNLLGILRYDCDIWVDLANHLCPLHRRVESSSKHSVCQTIFIFIPLLHLFSVTINYVPPLEE